MRFYKGTNNGAFFVWEDSMKTYRVTIPFQEMVHGRLFYLVEADSEEEAIEKVGEGAVEVHDSVTDGEVGSSFEEFPEDAKAEEW
jgi:hypothetical protein